jgi:hypothetical protein
LRNEANAPDRAALEKRSQNRDETMVGRGLKKPKEGGVEEKVVSLWQSILQPGAQRRDGWHVQTCSIFP